MKKTFLILCLGAVSAAAADTNLVLAVGRGMLPEQAAMFTYSTVFAELAERDARADAAWRGLKSRAAYDAYRGAMREKLAEALGPFPERTPLNARTTGTYDKDGYRIEKVVFESMPGLYVTGNLFIPTDPKFKAPYPAVVMSCGHSNVGKDCKTYSRACVIAAKAGLAAFMFDPYEQGERRQHKNTGSTRLHNIIGFKAMLLGWSMPGLRIWDGMRAIDYVQSRPEIDANKIGYMGNSGGGTATALMVAADDRIVAAAPSCYVTSLRNLCNDMGPQDAEQNIFGQLSFGLNHAGYLLLLNKAVALTCCFNDMFSYYGSCESFRTASAVMDAIGESGKIALNDVPGPHGWKESIETSSVAWMRAWLRGEKNLLPLDMPSYRALDVGFSIKSVDVGMTDEEWGATPTKRTMDLPGARDIHAILRDRLAAGAASRAALSPVAKAARATALAGVKTSVRNRMIPLGTQELSGMRLERFAFQYANGLSLPAVLLTPASGAPAVDKAPVILVGDKGRAALADAAAGLVAAGTPVLLADLTGYGEIGGFKHVFYGTKEMPEEGISAMLYLMGESMVGRRATDLLVLAKFLKERFGRAVALSAHGSAAIPAAHARAAAPELVASVAVADAPMSWTDFLATDGSVIYYYTHCVNGALQYYDWTELLR